MIMANCRQACPYNTLDGCKVKEYNAICPLTNMAKPITEYKMTNADRIRSMSDEELAEFIKNIKVRAALCKAVKNNDAFEELCSAEWLQQPAEEDDHE